MLSQNLAFVIAQATDPRQTSPFATAVRDSIEVGVVVPSILRNELEIAGFKLVDDKASVSDYGFKSNKVLQRVIVLDGDTIIAMGAASDPAEAILHAALGWFRENRVGEDEAPEGLTTLPA